MPRYMPQDVFDMGVVTISKIHILSDIPLSNLCEDAAKLYHNDYPDDVNILEEFNDASKSVIDLLLKQFSADEIALVLTHVQFLLINYELDGRRKRKKFFGGTFFNRTKSSNPNRRADCLRGIVVYTTGILMGKFERPPNGWSLEHR